jgi:hypothetical protein
MGNPANSVGLPFFFGGLSAAHFLILSVTRSRNETIMRIKTWNERNP